MTIELSPEEFTVSASEKISTGDYENHEIHLSLKGTIETSRPLNQERQKELKARVLALERDAQEAVRRAAENRIALPEDEDWGVTESDQQ